MSMKWRWWFCEMLITKLCWRWVYNIADRFLKEFHVDCFSFNPWYGSNNNEKLLNLRDCLCSGLTMSLYPSCVTCGTELAPPQGLGKHKSKSGQSKSVKKSFKFQIFRSTKVISVLEKILNRKGDPIASTANNIEHLDSHKRWICKSAAHLVKVKVWVCPDIFTTAHFLRC